MTRPVNAWCRRSSFSRSSKTPSSTACKQDRCPCRWIFPSAIKKTSCLSMSLIAAKSTMQDSDHQKKQTVTVLRWRTSDRGWKSCLRIAITSGYLNEQAGCMRKFELNVMIKKRANVQQSKNMPQPLPRQRLFQLRGIAPTHHKRLFDVAHINQVGIVAALFYLLHIFKIHDGRSVDSHKIIPGKNFVPFLQCF